MASPRSTYGAKCRERELISMRLIVALDAGRVEVIKREFSALHDVIGCSEFCRIIADNLPDRIFKDGTLGQDINSLSTPDTIKMRLLENLVELFKEVDVNGDGQMQWEEFSRFLVEKASVYHQAQSPDKMLEYHQAPLEVSGYRHRGSIDALAVIPRYRQFACVENHSNVIALFGSRTGALVTTMTCNAVPLNCCYIEPLQALVACCADSTIIRFNVGEIHHKVRYKQRSVWPTPDTQMTMCWHPTHNLLYSGSVGGRVHAWDVEKKEQKSTFEGHTDIVMDIKALDHLDSIVSASLDTHISIWDSYTEQQTARLTGHSMGVNSLAYNASHRFLISTGFDHDVFVWSPFVSTLLYKLKGHRAVRCHATPPFLTPLFLRITRCPLLFLCACARQALVGCSTVEGTSELITADTSGAVKLWDLRTFQCVSTFTSAHEAGDLDDLNGNLSCFVHAKLPSVTAALDGEPDDYRLIVGSKRVHFFDQARVRQDPVSDDGPIRVACFNAESLTILTASERNVKVWDALLGSLKQAFANVTASDISAACLDDRQRKFILGEASGAVTVFNYRNGTLMKRFSPQATSPVVGLVYCAASKSVIAAFMDGAVRVHDENDIDACKVLRSFDEAYAHRGDQVCVAHSPVGSISATGSTSDGIRLWDFDTGVCRSLFSRPPFPLHRHTYPCWSKVHACWTC